MIDLYLVDVSTKSKTYTITNIISTLAYILPPFSNKKGDKY